MFQDWISLCGKIAEKPSGEERFICPNCGKSQIDFQYVGDLGDRIGSLDVWCSACHKGVHISRVKAPLSAKMLSFDTPAEQLNDRIPRYVPVLPNEARGAK
jgi:hypothetical protein